MGKIRKPLADKILENSVSNHLPTAIKEWQSIAKIHNEIDRSIRCLCGTKGIKDWYELVNVKNNKVLIHIGANCIDYFTAATDYLPAKYVKKLGQLKRLASTHDMPEFSKSQFPKPLITYFGENDVFVERPENSFHAFNDYKRLSDLIYKGGSRQAYTKEEYAELTTLWTCYIKPYLLGTPRQELHIREIPVSVTDYQRRIQLLEAENAQLRQLLNKQIPSKAPTIPDTNATEPEGYSDLRTLCRRRKNRRNLRLEDLTPEVITYWEKLAVITIDEKATLDNAINQKGHALPLQLHQQSQELLKRLTQYLRKRS